MWTRGALPALLWLWIGTTPAIGSAPSEPQERIVEWTIQSSKAYADPFNDVELDVVFSKDRQSWRVPTFWRGNQQWTVRFAPPSPGEYTYRLECTDKGNRDLNGQTGRVRISAYKGINRLYLHGPLRVSANRRYFEHADTTPFYWLGDTWWTGLSSRLSWGGFQELTADRKAKGFTVVQIAGGLIPSNEELAPSDPGFCNEGGCVWEKDFSRINPQYFDYADRRILYLLDNELVPAIVGAWSGVLSQMGVAKMKQHWRYLVARYGAYPAFWIVGGEVLDPPIDVARRVQAASETNWAFDSKLSGGWSEVARYLRAADPYKHPVSVHEMSPDELPLQDESLTDFKMIGPSHFGWSSIGVEVAQIGAHYARRSVVKPIVQGEIGYEQLGGTHLEDFQRTAFWLSMLNGTAGYTYGANGVWEAYTGDKPLHRWRHSFLSWKEGMRLPGSYQIGLGAKLLQQYSWWRFEPHPEWIFPRGTTFFESRRDEENNFHMNLMAEFGFGAPGQKGEWSARNGDFRQPYAAGISSEVRVVYVPAFGLIPPRPPTIFGLEDKVRYRAYYWEPATGARVDLGSVGVPAPGRMIVEEHFNRIQQNVWVDEVGTGVRKNGALIATGQMRSLLQGINEKDVVVSVKARADAEAAIILRYRDRNNYLAAVYSSKDESLCVVERKQGVEGPQLGKTPVKDVEGTVRLRAEARGDLAIASVSIGRRTYTTPIVDVSLADRGAVGIAHGESNETQSFGEFEVRESPRLAHDDHMERSVYDAEGTLRGELRGGAMPMGPVQTALYGYNGWDDYGMKKKILLDAYLPERLPTAGDWVLILSAE